MSRSSSKGGASALPTSGRRLGDTGAIIFDLRAERERRRPLPPPPLEGSAGLPAPPCTPEFVALAFLMQGLTRSKAGRAALREARAAIVGVTADDGLRPAFYDAAHFIVAACKQIGLDKPR